MAATTAAAIIRGAFETIGVLGEGQTLDSAKGADGLRRLNLMVRSWSLQNLTIPVTVREVFDLVTDKGGPDDPYTIGPGGDFDTDRPPTQNALAGAGLILTSSDPAVEVPRAIYTDTMWEAIQIKDLSSGGDGIPTGIYYNPTYAGGLGAIYMWPVPSDDVNDIALYLRKPLAVFADQTTSVDVPDGSEEALEYNLALRLCAPYSVPVDPDVKAFARTSLAILKRSNYHLLDLTIDPALTGDRRYGYNIQTGNM
jgi:hypothetical protein